MKLRHETIYELGIILEEEFNIKLKPRELNDFAYFLMSFFGAFQKFENPPDPRIDNTSEEVHYKGEK